LADFEKKLELGLKDGPARALSFVISNIIFLTPGDGGIRVTVQDPVN
jgi:hypothetical protein